MGSAITSRSSCGRLESITTVSDASRHAEHAAATSSDSPSPRDVIGRAERGEQHDGVA